MKGYFYIEYYQIFIFLSFSIVLSCVILGLSFLFSSQAGDKEKLSAYECGFDPFEDARNKFDVRFYLIGILFIIFDLEASFLFPWSITLGNLSYDESFVSFWSMIDFILELGVGFIYAWNVGSLEW
jgi:NADH-quinone oxidoreductase subunit A